MNNAAEKIIRKICSACEMDAVVRLGADGGTAFYPVDDSLTVAFLDGGELRHMKIKCKLKGEIPGELFSSAEEICRSISGIASDDEIVRIYVDERPSMESSSENGMEIASFIISAEYVLEKGGEDENSI